LIILSNYAPEFDNRHKISYFLRLLYELVLCVST